MKSVCILLLSLAFLTTEAAFPAEFRENEAETITPPGKVNDAADLTTPGVVYDGAEALEDTQDPPPHDENEINANLTDVSLFEGDILLNEEQEREMADRKGINARSLSRYMWQKGRTIHYYMDSSITRRSDAVGAIYAAINHWQSKTCLRFKYAGSDGSQPALKFFTGGGCFSPIGRQTGRSEQSISIGYGCQYMGIVAHEIGHSLGFFHEQSRPDRDSYVRINWSNIKKGMEHNFKKQTTTYIDVRGIPYDLGSLMHYGAYGFAINRNVPTIQRLRGSGQMGQRNGLSNADVQMARKMYC